jgi:hypothetical protein
VLIGVTFSANEAVKAKDELIALLAFSACEALVAVFAFVANEADVALSAVEAF